jgi:DNA-binding NarL/FixJ family response regulator
MVLAGLVEALSGDAALEVVGQARSLAEAEEVLATTSADVVVTDLQLEDGSGTTLVEVADRASPGAVVLLISGFNDRRAVEAALDSGCAGFVSKGRGVDELIHAITTVARGAAVFPARVLADLMGGDLTKPFLSSALSDRELEVLTLLAKARSADQIADDLGVSLHTVRNHIRAVLTKLEARSQLEAVVIGVRAGLVVID